MDRGISRPRWFSVFQRLCGTQNALLHHRRRDRPASYPLASQAGTASCFRCLLTAGQVLLHQIRRLLPHLFIPKGKTRLFSNILIECCSLCHHRLSGKAIDYELLERRRRRRLHQNRRPAMEWYPSTILQRWNAFSLYLIIQRLVGLSFHLSLVEEEKMFISISIQMKMFF